MIDRALSTILPAIGVAVASFWTSSSGWAAEMQVPEKFPTIQAAIDAAQSGDTVLVQPGLYRERIRLTEGVEIRSAGDATAGTLGLARAEATILDAGGGAPAVVMAEGSCLNGLTVTRAGKFDQEEFDRHFAERGENLPDHRGAAGVEGASAAILIEGVSARVIHSIVRDNGHPGIAAVGSGNRSEILDNRVFRNMGGGVGIANGTQARVADNRCWENLRAGIGCRNASPIVENNHCFRNVRAGIGSREGATPLLRGNECYRNQRAGIGVRMSGTEPQIRSNRCYENGMAGIGCRDGAAPVIVGNECFNNRLAGIGATSNARPSIVGNKIHGNEKAAIGLDACDAGVALIRDNHIAADTLVCIGIRDGWTVTVAGNQISREGGMPPLVMVFRGAKAEFHGNLFEGSGVAAIRSQGQVFAGGGNQFHCPAPRQGGPPQQAVWALPGSMVSMTNDNEIRGWRKPEQQAARVTNREELREALRQAKPGTTILIAPGDYAGGLTARDLRGEAGRPIVISGENFQNPPVFKGGASGLHLVNPMHVELRNLIIASAKGNGLNIDDGGNPDTPARHVTLSDLVVRDIDGRGNRDGIKLSGVYDFRVDRCRIERWGNGGSGIDMVGCHRGVINDSVFIHTKGATSANGAQAKGGSDNIAIRRCRFENAGGRGVNLGGSTGAAFFRPVNATHEAGEISVIDCVFKGSTAAVAFVGATNGIVRNNTMHRQGRWILRILQENTDPKFVQCRDGVFKNNIVAFRSGELRGAVNIGPDTKPDTFLFSSNVWICLDQAAAAKRLIRLPSAEEHGVYSVKPASPQTADAAEFAWVLENPGIHFAGVRSLRRGVE